MMVKSSRFLTLWHSLWFASKWHSCQCRNHMVKLHTQLFTCSNSEPEVTGVNHVGHQTTHQRRVHFALGWRHRAYLFEDLGLLHQHPQPVKIHSVILNSLLTEWQQHEEDTLMLRWLTFNFWAKLIFFLLLALWGRWEIKLTSSPARKLGSLATKRQAFPFFFFFFLTAFFNDLSKLWRQGDEH